MIDLRKISSVKLFYIKLVDRNCINDFICKYHYSKSVNGVKSKYCFALFYNEIIIGAAILAAPATPGVSQKYSNGNELVEIRRLCCIDFTPKNTESYFIGQIMKWLKNNTNIDIILSYADPYFGHSGVIYKATNFKKIGKTKKRKVYFYKGKEYHEKALRTRYNGTLKPYSAELRMAKQEGLLQEKVRPGKHIFIYNLSKNKEYKLK